MRPYGESAAPAGSSAHEGGEVTGNDESAFMVDHGLHVLAHIPDDFRPGTGDLVLVEAGPAGHVIRGHRGVPDHDGRFPGRADAGNGFKRRA